MATKKAKPGTKVAAKRAAPSSEFYWCFGDCIEDAVAEMSYGSVVAAKNAATAAFDVEGEFTVFEVRKVGTFIIKRSTVIEEVK